MGTRRKGAIQYQESGIIASRRAAIYQGPSVLSCSTLQNKLSDAISLWQRPRNRATNHKDHEEQVCRVLDRQEKLALFELYIHYRLCTSTSKVDANPPCVVHLFDNGAPEPEATPTINSLSTPRTIVIAETHKRCLYG